MTAQTKLEIVAFARGTSRPELSMMLAERGGEVVRAESSPVKTLLETP